MSWLLRGDGRVTRIGADGWPVRGDEHGVAPSALLRDTACLLDGCEPGLRLTRTTSEHVIVPDGAVFLREWMRGAAVDLEGVTDPPATALDADILDPLTPLVEFAHEVRARLRC
ncbi:hypothetical protein [Prauserella cavernicola]|uniref:Uncharacterized protein n=1 Tax=Prauserella cavernicola TaxID=2800127 RepID=A0A934V1P1_9PSEU|nr:hypothetical protein [Prauserella cavernicola]MBK1783611.1 hypothetical protein [Prauserella cavernicola]